MVVYILYQDVSGGVKTATEAIIRELARTDLCIKTYKQRPHFFAGPFAYTRWFFGSVLDCVFWLNAQPASDWVYATSLVPAIAHLFSRHRSVKLYYHFHGDQRLFIDLEQVPKGLYGKVLGKIINRLQKYALDHANRIGFVSRFVQKQCFRLYPELIRKKEATIIVPNGVDFSKFLPVTRSAKERLRRRYGFLKQDHVVLCVARMDRTKRIDELIAAFHSLKLERKQLVLVFPKDMDEYSKQYLIKIRRFIDLFCLQKKIHFFLSPTHIEQLYQLADCCVLSSKNESFSLVALESIACGTPFIGRPVGNIPAIVQKINRRLLLYSEEENDVQKTLSWFFSLSRSQIAHLRRQSLLVARHYGWETSAGLLYKYMKETK